MVGWSKRRTLCHSKDNPPAADNSIEVQPNIQKNIDPPPLKENVEFEQGNPLKNGSTPLIPKKW